MKFPVPGDHVPQTVGTRRLGSLRPQHGPERARATSTTCRRRRSTTAATSSAPPSTTRRWRRCTRPSARTKRRSTRAAVPFDLSYMHAGAVLEDPGTGAIQAVYAGPGYIGAKYNGTGRVITTKLCAKIACQWNMAVYNREQVGSSFKPYVLAAAVKAGHERADQHAQRVQQPLHRAGQPAQRRTRTTSRPVPPAVATSCTTTRRRRTGRTRRRSRWRCRSTPPTPTCGTGWAVTAVANMAQAFRGEHQRRLHHRVLREQLQDGGRGGRRARPGVADGRASRPPCWPRSTTAASTTAPT